MKRNVGRSERRKGGGKRGGWVHKEERNLFAKKLEGKRKQKKGAHPKRNIFKDG